MRNLNSYERQLLDGYSPLCIDCTDTRLCPSCSAHLETLQIEVKLNGIAAVRRLVWEHEGITLDSAYFLKRYTTLLSIERQRMGSDPSHDQIVRIRRYENLIDKFQA